MHVNYLRCVPRVGSGVRACACNRFGSQGVRGATIDGDVPPDEVEATADGGDDVEQDFNLDSPWTGLYGTPNCNPQSYSPLEARHTIPSHPPAVFQYPTRPPILTLPL
jgi:hypothetical protein